MPRTELIIQLLKIAIALAFGAYFVWWSLQVLDRLTPEYGAATAMVGRILKIQPVVRRAVMDANAGFWSPPESQLDHGYALTRERVIAAFAAG